MIKKVKNIQLCHLEDVTWGWYCESMYCASCGFTTTKFSSMRNHVRDNVSDAEVEVHWNEVLSASFGTPDRSNNKNPKWKPGYLEFFEEEILGASDDHDPDDWL